VAVLLVAAGFFVAAASVALRGIADLLRSSPGLPLPVRRGRGVSF
jgi:hypothetical protein